MTGQVYFLEGTDKKSEIYWPMKWRKKNLKENVYLHKEEYEDKEKEKNEAR